MTKVIIVGVLTQFENVFFLKSGNKVKEYFFPGIVYEPLTQIVWGFFFLENSQIHSLYILMRLIAGLERYGTFDPTYVAKIQLAKIQLIPLNMLGGGHS